MNKTEVTEIKKIFKKDDNGITRICGCYVDGEKNKRVELKEAFYSLPEEEMFKYVDIFRKTMSGTLGKNLMNMEFPMEEETNDDGKQKFMMKLVDSGLQDDALLDEFYDMVIKSGCTPNEYTTSMSHVQLNPSATKVMMRLSVANCPVFGALGCIDLETGKTHVIPDKPVHQLWFDDDTYMATRQYYDGSKIEMETSRIQRFTPNGECIETLGGIGNHIDGSPDRSYFVGDRAYPGYPADIFLYRRGETTPIATFGGQNFQNCTWKLQIHPNPTFSRDGKRIYFNHPVSENRTEACFVEIDDLLK